MLPENLVAEFWDSVQRELRTLTDFPEERIQVGIARYRDTLASREVTELIYHRDPEDIAKTISTSEFIRGYGTNVIRDATGLLSSALLPHLAPRLP